MTTPPKSIFHHARHPHILKTSIRTALIVGTVLALINHFDSIFTWTLTSTQVFQILITYLVPFSVASYAAAKHAQRIEEIKEKAHNQTH
ncbi:MAG: nitrate/nitrite transporter NrtS [Candidatus Campbellbacteria bacterium]|nr:nitrate/nitrite transporter NrtS [Candidatus Campbellbacteria bacterium]